MSKIEITRFHIGLPFSPDLADRSFEKLRFAELKVRNALEGEAMTSKSLHDEAHRFVDRTKDRYIILLKSVKAACLRVQDIERQVVKDVYSRGEKQKSNSELKETWKLPKKLLKMRQAQEKEAQEKQAQEKQAQPDGKVAATGAMRQIGWNDLPDVIGVTVVVYYPDQIVGILERVLAELKPQQIVLSGTIEPKNDFGYHAHHAVVVSRHSAHAGLRCEIQCKTMLHDSWATKMHDLTYKPMGFLEPRLELLMQAFGDTLQSVERQSQAIRDMIMERWNAEAERRRLTHASLFASLEAAMKRPDLSDNAKKVREYLEEKRSEIAEAPNAEVDVVKEARRQIDEVCSADIKEGWVLAALLASSRPKADLVDFLDLYADQWLMAVEQQVKSGATVEIGNVTAVPLAYIAAGSLDVAIDCYRKLLHAPGRYRLDDRTIRHCKYNHANALIERHYYEPDEVRDGPVIKLRRRVEDLLKASGMLASATADAKRKAIVAASANDTKGFMKISLGTTPEEVSDGIDQCYQGREVARQHAEKTGMQYCDLHLRLGWRKLLELEAQRRQKT